MLHFPSMDAINEFWRWFRTHKDAIQASLMSDSRFIEDEFPRRVRLLNKDLGWEVGPGIQKDYAFVLSPNGVAAQLQLVEHVISYAPVLEGWEYFAGKPPKRWNLVFEMKDDVDQTIVIDGRDWKYSLVGYNNREFFDITLITDSVDGMSEESRQLAGYTLLEGILGERLVLAKMGKIVVRPETESDRFASLSQISFLSSHLDELLG